MDEVNYYMIITTPDSHKVDIENNFSIIGFPDRNRNSVKNFKVGDKIVFYITKKSVFGTIAEVTSEYFHSTEKIWDNEFDFWPHRVNARPIYKIIDFNSMVYIKDIWDNLHFIKNKHKWGSQVQGSYRKLSKHDFNVIQNEVSKRCQR